MPAHTPEEVQRLFADAFGSHDLESVLALYEPDATLIPQPGEVVTGTEAIREALIGFLGPRIEYPETPSESRVASHKAAAHKAEGDAT